jgi:hypothetical protein
MTTLIFPLENLTEGYRVKKTIKHGKEMKTLLDTGASPRGWHRLQLALECLQKFGYHYEVGLGKRDDTNQKSPPLIKGSLIHLGLAHYYSQMKAVQQGTDPGEFEDPITAMRMVAEKNGEAWIGHTDTCIKAYLAYVAHWQNENLKILEVEKLAYTHIGEYLFTGRFDLIYEDRRGKVWVCDHKTTGRIYAKQKRFYGISGQLTGYAYMASQIYGNRFAGIILNQIQHVPPYKFVRMPLPPAPNLFKRFPQIVIDAEERIKAIKETGRKPTDWPMAANELTCFHRYGACNFLDQCRWGNQEKE